MSQLDEFPVAPGAPQGRWAKPFNRLGVALLLGGLALGAAGLLLLWRELRRPGEVAIEPWQWWLVVVGALAALWSAPCFLRARARTVTVVVAAVLTLAILAVAGQAVAEIS